MIASAKSKLLAVIGEYCKSCPPVRLHERYPTPGRIGPNDPIVVDLIDPTLLLDRPTGLLPCFAKTHVWLIAGNRPVAPGWLDIARLQAVDLVHCVPGDEERGFRALTTALDQYLEGFSGGRLAALVLLREPGLKLAVPLIQIICSAPWSIRRPSQLARAANTTPRTLKLQCGRLGFRRVEHFITLIRNLAFKQLIEMLGCTPAQASVLSGIADRSNLRRQLRRAEAGSPEAFSYPL